MPKNTDSTLSDLNSGIDTLTKLVDAANEQLKKVKASDLNSAASKKYQKKLEELVDKVNKVIIDSSMKEIKEAVDLSDVGDTLGDIAPELKLASKFVDIKAIATSVGSFFTRKNKAKVNNGPSTITEAIDTAEIEEAEKPVVRAFGRSNSNYGSGYGADYFNQTEMQRLFGNLNSMIEDIRRERMEFSPDYKPFAIEDENPERVQRAMGTDEITDALNTQIEQDRELVDSRERGDEKRAVRSNSLLMTMINILDKKTDGLITRLIRWPGEFIKRLRNNPIRTTKKFFKRISDIQKLRKTNESGFTKVVRAVKGQAIKRASDEQGMIKKLLTSARVKRAENIRKQMD